ncbi:insertion element IS2 transposase InsD [Shigella sonnei]|uniref:IS3 family transposase n=1 Tax=Shigella sonnei TaxID=624 RepID=UPI000DA59BC6|nr:IS3 family transposase [Shigella sonnei]SRT30677.1 insertion element IS2 transposase InsD [Shigella sonnei]SRV12538.1 insertion element IS2 transposase InsD [Shigella sonnei]
MLSREDFYMIKQMRQQGAYIVDIATQIGCSERTVRRYLKYPEPPARKTRHKMVKLKPFMDYIDMRLAENVWNSEVIFAEIKAMGYTGGRSMLRYYIQPKRKMRPSKRTVRFETQPGYQLQHDWGEVEVEVAGQRRAQLHVILRRTDDWMDGRRSRHTDDTDVLLRIHHVIGELPTYGYRRVWALLRRQAELDGMPAINAKRVYRIMRQNALLLERKPAVPPSKRAHTGRVAVKESNQRWCSDGFEFCCDNGERLRVTFALDCCDREALHWAVTTGGFNSETVQDVMLGAVERRFGNDLPSSPVEWLTDNGLCYRANETRQFARMLGLEPKNTAVRSPESNGIAESFVKTIKRDYISIMPKPDGLTAAKNLAEAFEHYNEWHPHSALGYRSPREYLRQRACNGLSDNRCLEI